MLPISWGLSLIAMSWISFFQSFFIVSITNARIAAVILKICICIWKMSLFLCSLEFISSLLKNLSFTNNGQEPISIWKGNDWILNFPGGGVTMFIFHSGFDYKTLYFYFINLFYELFSMCILRENGIEASVQWLPLFDIFTSI